MAVLHPSKGILGGGGGEEADHEDEGIGRGHHGQQVEGNVLVVQHLQLRLARPRRRLAADGRVAHLRSNVMLTSKCCLLCIVSRWLPARAHRASQM